MLRIQAAIVLEQPGTELIARDGGFHLGSNPKKRISYGELVKRGAEWQVPDKEVPLKPESSFRLIGHSVQRLDIPGKVTGETVFGYDMHLEGMLYGAVARPPTIDARMVSAQPGKAASMSGVVRVFIEKDFAGVVANSQIQAEAARDALAIEWDPGRTWQQKELEELVTLGGPDGVTIQRKGSTSSMLKRKTPVFAEYSTSFAAHANLEPQAAVAEVRAGEARVWTSTQHEYSTRAAVAEALDVDVERVEIIPCKAGGGFGRKSGSGAGVGVAAEAALLSRAVGRPVKVNWNREEEMRNGYFRPFTRHRLSAVMDDIGNIEAMENLQASGDALLNFLPKLAARIIGFDFGGARGTLIPYNIPNRKVTVWRHQMPILTGPWRGVGLFPNIFPLESFVDELAHIARIDPLEFRLNHLSSDGAGKRMRAVLQAAAERSGWGRSPAEGRARGIACCEDAESFVAEVAEISLDRRTNRIRVHRVVAAIDCGKVINPDGIVAQVQGAITMGISAALLEEITVKDGRVEAGNFGGYPLLSMSEAPEVETVLLEGSESGKPGGVGEPPIGPIAPAIGNAFFALTGKRIRRLPITAERVKKAIG
jgi:isoquinoline 1-oxidoreductase beta subunit